MAHITVYSQLKITEIVLKNLHQHLKNWGGFSPPINYTLVNVVVHGRELPLFGDLQTAGAFTPY
jgi:hypothetical protein